MLTLINENIARNECIPISARDTTTHECPTTSQNTDTQHKGSKLEVFKPLVLEVRKSLLHFCLTGISDCLSKKQFLSSLSFQKAMLKFSCPLPDCTFETEDLNEAVAAVMITIHANATHTNTVPKSTTQNLCP